MNRRLHVFLPLLIFCLLAVEINGQECGHCKQMPRVANYDLEVAVPKLADTGEAMLQWRMLFWLGRHANNYVFHQNKDCVRFTQPVYSDGKENETLIIGATHAMLPPAGDISNFGDYILTGFVRKNNDVGILHLELQTACSRKSVASADVPFNFSTESSYLMGIAQQAAMHLSPLIDKIKQFELAERNGNRQVAISGFSSQEIKITPKKSMLKPGEETDFDIEVMDCDGSPLKDAEVEFSNAVIEGFNIEATKGGIVSPAKIRTDASGKAKAKFKMNTGTRSATINAHCLVKKPNGCNDALVGAAEISTTPHLKVVLDYQLYQSQKMGLASVSKVHSMEVGMDSSSFMRNHRTMLYYYPSGAKQDINANIFPKPIPGFSDGSRFAYIVDGGFFMFNTSARNNRGHEGMANTGIEEKDTVIINAGAARPNSRPEIHFNIMGDQLKNFSIEFNYPEEVDNEDVHPGYPSGFTIESTDPDAKFTTTKITAPNSRYKTEYKVTFTRKTNKAISDLYKSDVVEEFYLTVLSSY